MAKFDKPKIIENLLKALEGGNTRRNSCRIAGVSEETFYTWIREDEDFKLKVEKAESVAIEAAVATVVRASLTDYKAATWFLARKEREWQEKTQTDITSKDEKIEFTIDLGKNIEPNEEV